MNYAPLGKILIIVGIAIVVLGVAFLFIDKIPFLGKLPGDIMIRGKSTTAYFPLVTSILLSLFLTAIFLIINLIRK